MTSFHPEPYSAAVKWSQVGCLQKFLEFFFDFFRLFEIYFFHFSALVILYVLRACKMVNFPRMSRDIVRQVFPLPVFYLANMLTGLGSTALLSLPMFTVLRRFSILFTMIMEFIVLQVLDTKIRFITFRFDQID